MKTETSKLVETANSVKPVVSGSLLDELLTEFEKYREQIAGTKTITDNQYRLIVKGILGCKQIAKKVLSNTTANTKLSTVQNSKAIRFKN